ncbi:UNVERIFIED_ORG: hypothetical protein M2438_002928 [Methylobacterium sp. SuP10 SLI 274]|uniref:hypothetical protein n=1 Tax=Methylorubrum extorquens TaxID=408 RepID=UPI0020A0ADE6|nr:hypothetical protein [Methylorubrum extorquens]MDF9864160.1 hypothetical protein [Methylorubrum pseudosasae]MDH6637753.1 hypothetical protein [Methylobacterium sp. SuP10 SLI 274]MDH6666932.1 hypothetical protein [Methylorubrum zatmanii]MCP1558838.1 hypothetical protein [Methylorubrum extorquens]MDF9792472.1 hypothetical protein [Methylorubrum extorquens]
MDDQLDAGMAEVMTNLIRARRAVDPATFLHLLGSIMVEIDEGMEVALEAAYRRPEGNVLPFPVRPGSRGGEGIDGGA